MSETEYRTSHRYLAAYLLSRNYSLLRYEQENGLVIFCFQSVEGLEEEIQKFHSNTILVRPQDFIQGLEMVKSIIREERSSEERREP